MLAWRDAAPKMRQKAVCLCKLAEVLDARTASAVGIQARGARPGADVSLTCERQDR